MNVETLIEVRPPYFALTNVRVVSPGKVSAIVFAEQPLGHELGALAAAEAGRHLAIAGSCACASLEPAAGKRFYLATRATLRRESNAPAYQGPLMVEAEALHRDKRQAKAQASIRDVGGRLIFSLEIAYMVLEERVFQRLFSAHRVDLRADDRPEGGDFQHLRRNPYRDPIELTISHVDRDSAAASLPALSSEQCAGHFPMYPAMPIATLMYGLSWLSGEVLRARYGAHFRYFVQGGTVEAGNLAFAGEEVRFETKWHSSEEGNDTFEARALLNDGSVAGSMQLWVRRVEHARADQTEETVTPSTAPESLRRSVR